MLGVKLCYALCLLSQGSLWQYYSVKWSPCDMVNCSDIKIANEKQSMLGFTVFSFFLAPWVKLKIALAMEYSFPQWCKWKSQEQLR